MDKSQRVALGIAVVVLVVLGWLLSGCQCVGGLCRDIESAARYGHEHIVVDE